MKPSVQAIYLASKSPRRRELLHQIGINHELLLTRSAPPRGPDVVEDPQPDEAPESYVARIASEKAIFGWKALAMRDLPLRPVLAADTTVVIAGQIMGKPSSRLDAENMMRQLSGKTHQVLTAVSAKYHEQHLHALQVSEVTFAPLDESVISAYCSTDEPYDKAGGYGIQGRAALFIEKISGSYSSIMGLPIYETGLLLRRLGVNT